MLIQNGLSEISMTSVTRMRDLATEIADGFSNSFFEHNIVKNSNMLTV